MTKQRFPTINVCDDNERAQPEPAKVDNRTAEERAMASVARSVAAVSKQIRCVEHALEVGGCQVAGDVGATEMKICKQFS